MKVIKTWMLSCLVVIVLLLTAIDAFAQVQTTRVSINSSGLQVSNNSIFPSISSDGRYVAFASDAPDLVLGDFNISRDVFVHDRQTGQTFLVSVNSSGTQGNFDSYGPSISADGRYVAFQSSATNLVAGDNNFQPDVFVRDRQLLLTIRVSVDTSGGDSNNISQVNSISADGRYVAFGSSASDLVTGDINNADDVFVRDLQTNQTTRVSVDSLGAQANGQSNNPSISADGWYVVFASSASNLVTGDNNTANDIFVHDIQTSQTTRVSVNSAGTGGNGVSGGLWLSSISADGRYVAFDSEATNLVAGDNNSVADVFVRDRQLGLTTRVSVSSAGTEGINTSNQTSMSSAGRYVAFRSYANNLVSDDGNGLIPDIFVHDRLGGRTVRVSVDTSSGDPNNSSSSPSISSDGRYVAFDSIASDLVENDTNVVSDIFVSESLLAIPTMTEWGMLIFAVLTGLGSIYYLRMRRL